jgi:hypothetical protein
LKYKLLFIMLIISSIFYSQVYSLNDNICATAEITSISPSSVRADEDFTVGILIDNCGEKIPENVTFEITKHSNDIIIKDPLIVDIGKIGYANSKRFITFNMRSAQNATSGKHVIETKLSYGSRNYRMIEEDSFSIIINNLKPDLMISSISTTPEILYKDQKILLNIEIENAGKGDAKDVRINIKNTALEGVKSKYLGNIVSYDKKSETFVFEKKNVGIYNADIYITYRLDGKINELIYPIQFQVFEKEEPKLTLSRIYTIPEIIYSNEKITLIIDIENTGEGDAQDVRLEIKNDKFKGTKINYLGLIKVDENMPARFVLETTGPGRYSGNVKLNYKYGGEINELIFPLEVHVFQKSRILFILLIILLIILPLMYNFFRHKKQSNN